jgi:hypothetical protein
MKLKALLVAALCLLALPAHAQKLSALPSGGSLSPNDLVAATRNGNTYGVLAQAIGSTSYGLVPPTYTYPSNYTLTVAGWAAPTGGSSSGVTTFNSRANAVTLLAADVGSVVSVSPVTHQFLTGLNSAGAFSQAQPAFSDISGTVAGAQLPAPTTSTFGGVLALASSTAHQVVQYINTSGQQVLAQLGFADLSGTISAAQLGTGYTNGQLLIGSTGTGQLATGTLTAGSNVTITNGPGTITIAASGTGGSMVYPGAGIPLSTGSAWGTSYGTSGTGNVALTAGATLTGASVNGVSLTTGGASTQFLNAAGSYSTPTGTGSGVTSFAGRTGVVVGSTGDYIVSQITGAAPLASPTFTGTVTLPANQAVNGVTLQSGGSTSSYLNAFGTYTTPAGGGGSVVLGTAAAAPSPYSNSSSTTGLYSTGANQLGFSVASTSMISVGSATVALPYLNSAGVVVNDGSGNLTSAAASTAAQSALQYIEGKPAFYVTNYGAKCDGLVLSDVTTTASSAVITSSSHSFIAADVNKYIDIYAGTATSLTASITANSNVVTVSSTSGVRNTTAVYGTGIQAGTTVSAILSSTQFTMSKAASATNATAALTTVEPIATYIVSTSGGAATLNTNMTTAQTGALATFGTNDASAFQTAENAAAVSGGIVRFPAAMCVVGATINVGNEVSFQGLGAGKSIIKWLSQTAMTTAVFKGYTGSNSCTPDIARGWTDNQFRDFEIDASAALVSPVYIDSKAISMNCTVRMVQDHIYAHDTPATCLAGDYQFGGTQTFNIVQNCGALDVNGVGGNGIGDATEGLVGESYIIAGNTIINPGHVGALVENQTSTSSNAHVIIADNYIQATQTQGSIGQGGIDDGSIGGVITGNRVFGPPYTNSAWACIRASSGTTSQSPGLETVITGNSAENCGYAGILVDQTTNGSLPANVLVANNRVKNIYNSGIRFLANASSPMDGVSVVGNTVLSSFGSGISFTGAGGFKNVKINDNTLANNGTSGGGYVQSGISASSNIAGLTMVGNLAYDDATGTQKYGFAINTGVSVTNALTADNNFDGNATSPYDILGTISGVLQTQGSSSSGGVALSNSAMNAATAGSIFDLSSASDSMILPIGTTGTRPTGVNGMLRYNSTGPQVEAYVGNTWTAIGTTGGGGGITALTGDVTASGSGSVAATVNSIGGDANVAFLDKAEVFTKSQRGTPVAVTLSTSTFSPDFSTSNNQTFALVHASCPCTIANPTNIVAGQSGMLAVSQSSTGSDTITWGTYFKFAGGTAPTLSTTASATDLLPYYVIDSTHIAIGAGVLNAH